MTRRRRVDRVYPVAAALGLAGTLLAFRSTALAACLVLAGLVLFVSSAVGDTRSWWRMWMRATVVYKHRSAGHDKLPRGKVVYVGISNRPDLRRGQHQTGSWWAPLCDPALYTQEWHRTRLTAALVERWTIRARCPVGNTQHNRRYWDQLGRRAQLRTAADRIAGGRS